MSYKLRLKSFDVVILDRRYQFVYFLTKRLEFKF